tara:strand:+ start:4047 stop:4223 length:177 start_codon:yes stop_codon:yes gene_type:complete
MALVYGKDSPSKLRRKKVRSAKKEDRKIRKHAKWSGLDINKPKDKKLATDSYRSLASK